MKRTASAVDLAVRCFESAEEIRELATYKEGNPLTKQSYSRLLGYYNLPVKLHCCLEKANGNLCKHEHGKGWVVEKLDGTCTLLGKDCANDKFGADPRLIKDILNYTNAIKRQARLTKVLVHLEKRVERTRALSELQSALDGLSSRVLDFLGQLGPRTTRRLQDMYRSRSAEVVVTVVRYREYEERGQTRRERSTFQHRLGALNGLAVVSRESYTPVYVAISNILLAFDAASKLSDRPKKGEVDALAGQLDDFERVMAQGRALLDCEAQFKANNMEFFCFLVDDRAERYKCARLAMHQAGVPGGKDNAKVWLSNRELDLRTHLNVDAIEIR
jgi:hypothetical protein